MANYALAIVVIGVVLALGLPMIVKLWGLHPPPGTRGPRPNIRRGRLRQWILPGGLAVLALAGLAYMVNHLSSAGKTEQAGVRNAVTQPVDSRSGSDSGSKSAGLPEGPGTPTGGRRLLVADSPLAKAALKAAPVASVLEGLGQTATRKAPLTASANRSKQPAETKPTRTEAKDEREGQEKTAESKPKAETKPKSETKSETKTEAKVETKPKADAKPKSEAPAPKTDETSNGGGPFSLHLGSFSDKANADHAAARLKSSGVQAYLSRIEVEGKVFHRLMVGHFPTKAKAEAYGRELQQKGLTKDTGTFTVKQLGADGR